MDKRQPVDEDEEGTPQVFEYHGLRFISDGVTFTFDDFVFEPQEVMLASHLNPGCKVVCAGGGMGLVATAIALAVGVDNLLVIEPNPHLVFFMRQNIKVNGRSLNIRESALGVSGEYAFYLNRTNWALSTVSTDKVVSGSSVGTSLSALLDEGYNTLFLDLEGAEVNVVKDKAIEGFGLLVIEYHVPEDLIDPHLEQAGFVEQLKVTRKDPDPMTYKVWEKEQS